MLIGASKVPEGPNSRNSALTIHSENSGVTNGHGPPSFQVCSLKMQTLRSRGTPEAAFLRASSAAMAALREGLGIAVSYSP
jgi:hypothetical protein